MDIKQNPTEQDDGRDDAQGVVAEERMFAMLFHEHSMIVVRTR
jgi:hypothetical protein